MQHTIDKKIHDYETQLESMFNRADARLYTSIDPMFIEHFITSTATLDGEKFDATTWSAFSLLIDAYCFYNQPEALSILTKMFDARPDLILCIQRGLNAATSALSRRPQVLMHALNCITDAFQDRSLIEQRSTLTQESALFILKLITGYYAKGDPFYNMPFEEQAHYMLTPLIAASRAVAVIGPNFALHLLDQGAQADGVDSCKMTALNYALMHRNKVLVSELLARFGIAHCMPILSRPPTLEESTDELIQLIAVHLCEADQAAPQVRRAKELIKELSLKFGLETTQDPSIDLSIMLRALFKQVQDDVNLSDGMADAVGDVISQYDTSLVDAQPEETSSTMPKPILMRSPLPYAETAPPSAETQTKPRNRVKLA